MLCKFILDLGDGVIADQGENTFITSQADLDTVAQLLLSGLTFKRAKVIDLETGKTLRMYITENQGE